MFFWCESGLVLISKINLSYNEQNIPEGHHSGAHLDDHIIGTLTYYISLISLYYSDVIIYFADKHAKYEENWHISMESQFTVSV